MFKSFNTYQMKTNSPAYFLLLLVGLCIISISFIDKGGNSTTREHQNTLEDMHEWMQWDIEEGRVDSTVGHIYLETINQLITNNQQAWHLKE